LRSFQKRIADFEKRGLRVAAISVDTNDVSQRYGQKMGFTLSLLSDANAEVIRRYDVLHPHAGPKSADIARPAEFLIDSSGIVRWVNLTENASVRARPAQVLKAFDESIGANAP
jgi:peroxiredoxin